MIEPTGKGPAGGIQIPLTFIPNTGQILAGMNVISQNRVNQMLRETESWKQLEPIMARVVKVQEIRATQTQNALRDQQAFNILVGQGMQAAEIQKARSVGRAVAAAGASLSPGFGPGGMLFSTLSGSTTAVDMSRLQAQLVPSTGQRLSGSTTVTANPLVDMSAAQIMAKKTPAQIMTAWALSYQSQQAAQANPSASMGPGGMFATGMSNAGLSGGATVDDQSFGGKAGRYLDDTLKSLARRGPLVAAVVASAIVSSTVGAAIMAPVVQATHGGYSPGLAQSAASQQMGLGVLRGLGSIPLLGAAFSGMASRQEAEIQWAQEAAKTNATMPFQSQAMRASARGDTPAEVQASRAAEHQDRLAAQDMAKQKALTAVEGFGLTMDDQGNVKRSKSGGDPWAITPEITDEAKALVEAFKTVTKNMAAFDVLSASMKLKAEGVQSGQWMQNIGGAASNWGMATAAIMSRQGGDPRQIFGLGVEASATEMNAKQYAERMAMTDREENPLWNSTITRQKSERGRFMAEQQFSASQFVYAAPTAGIYSAAEATGAAEKSAIQMGQANEMWGKLEPVLMGIFDAIKENAKNTYNGT